jgi:hypothetical protein
MWAIQRLEYAKTLMSPSQREVWELLHREHWSQMEHSTLLIGPKLQEQLAAMTVSSATPFIEIRKKDEWLSPPKHNVTF